MTAIFRVPLTVFSVDADTSHLNDHFSKKTYFQMKKKKGCTELNFKYG